jgi:hypothetical protein
MLPASTPRLIDVDFHHGPRFLLASSDFTPAIILQTDSFL